MAHDDLADSEWTLPSAENIDRYRCWFRYLQHSNKDTWAAFVTHDFGDVYNTDFETWWPTHNHLFRRLKPFVIDDIPNLNKFSMYEGDGSLESGDIAVVAVHLYWPKKMIKQYFDEWLNAIHKTKRGAPPFEDNADEYHLHREPDIYMLNMALDTYLAVKKDNESQSTKKRSKTDILLEVGYIKKPKNDKPWSKTNLETHERTVNRFLHIAGEVLANVVIGKFPVYKVSK
jgi:hypothetical protein